LLLLCIGQMVYAVRERLGRQLAIEASVEADIVSTVPDSATPATLGYAHQVGSVVSYGRISNLIWSFVPVFLLDQIQSTPVKCRKYSTV